MKFNKQQRRLATGLAFLLPNILGFLAFTLVPLVASFGMAFTDWDIQRHNLFRDDPLRFVGLDNFVRLFSHPDFYRFLGNTFFLMLGLPAAIGGSLLAALLLTRAGKTNVSRGVSLVIASLVLVTSLSILLWGGMQIATLLFIFGCMAATILVGGVVTGGMLYRTLFYLPHFTSGVATFVLWKKLYNPETGPINQALNPVLASLEKVGLGTGGMLAWGGPALFLSLLAWLIVWQVRRMRRLRGDGELGAGAMIGATLAMTLPLGLGASWVFEGSGTVLGVVIASTALTVWVAKKPVGIPWRKRLSWTTGLAREVTLSLALVPGVIVLVGLAVLLARLPEMAQVGLEPPGWLGDYYWAKPAIMIMALWAAIGSNNMILYIAGLSNIPTELYEAADIDGASSWQRFAHVTWPQLAPVTFFITVMSVIHGLQGGFEMARTMTGGGPAGATTTLSYFIYIEGFETGRLGYASAVAWVLFGFVFSLSLVNVKFGNRYVQD